MSDNSTQEKESSGSGVDVVGAASGAVAGVAAITNIGTIMSSVSGTLPKAILFVPDIKSDYDVSPEAAIKSLGGVGNIGGQLKKMENQDVLSLRKLLKTRKKPSKLSKLASSVAGQIVDPNLAKKATLKTTYAEIKAEMTSRKYVMMEMQYNPTSVRITSSGGSMFNAQGLGDNGMMLQSSATIKSTLSVQLVFQQIDQMDAFWFQGMNLNTAINSAASIGKTVVEGEHSVQVPVEGLLSLIHFKRSKQVIFYWSEMFFHGELTSVSVNYKMFNSRGKPIYATVDLSIHQPDSGDEFASDKEEWNGAIDQAFSESFTSLNRTLKF